MRLCEQQVTIPISPKHTGLLSHIEQALRFRMADGEVPLRFVVTETDAETYHCEIGVTAGDGADYSPDSILKFIRRDGENAEHFNAVLLVPTGIGAEIGRTVDRITGRVIGQASLE